MPLVPQQQLQVPNKNKYLPSLQIPTMQQQNYYRYAFPPTPSAPTIKKQVRFEVDEDGDVIMQNK